MPRAGLDQQIVLQAAAEIVDQHGWETLTLALLAQKLGIRTPSLYNHVNGLPGLRHKLAIYGMQQLKEALTNAAIGQSNPSSTVNRHFWAYRKSRIP
jgi:AcrR family transcriptional regulator